MKQAVCIVIPSLDSVIVPGTAGRFIAITRKGTTDQWGLPGGKVDPGETNLDAVIRETLEELFLEVDPIDLIPIYSCLCPGEVPYWVTTYLYPKLIALCDLKPEHGLFIKALMHTELCDLDISPFAEYNKDVFKALDKYIEAEYQTAKIDLQKNKRPILVESLTCS